MDKEAIGAATVLKRDDLEAETGGVKGEESTKDAMGGIDLEMGGREVKAQGLQGGMEGAQGRRGCRARKQGQRRNKNKAEQDEQTRSRHSRSFEIARFSLSGG